MPAAACNYAPGNAAAFHPHMPLQDVCAAIHALCGLGSGVAFRNTPVQASGVRGTCGLQPLQPRIVCPICLYIRLARHALRVQQAMLGRKRSFIR